MGSVEQTDHMIVQWCSSNEHLGEAYSVLNRDLHAWDRTECASLRCAELTAWEGQQMTGAAGFEGRLSVLYRTKSKRTRVNTVSENFEARDVLEVDAWLSGTR